MLFYKFLTFLQTSPAVQLVRLLPPLWQVLFTLDCNNPDFKSLHRPFEDGIFRRRLIAIYATDISMLICFGALFPPLAVIIALSVLKDVMSIRLALGRYCEIMEAVQDESLKEQMVKVREAMDEEMLKAGAGIWNGVWYGMVMGTWIWGFVLFDTMASVEGVEKGLCVLIGMVVAPFLFDATIQVTMNSSFNVFNVLTFYKFILSISSESSFGLSMIETFGGREGGSQHVITTKNPILDEEKQLEMRVKNLVLHGKYNSF
jgi:hypothetical protein